MKLEGSHVLPGPREKMYALLTDPAVLKRCVPGCQRLDATGPDAYATTLEAGIGPVKGVFEGSIRLADATPPERFDMIVEGKGKQGFVKGRGSIVLEVPDGAAPTTRVQYTGDVQVGGTIASVGQRMVGSAAKVMAGQFFAAMEAEAKAVGAGAAPPKHGPFLDLLRYLVIVVKRLFGLRGR